MPFEEFITVVAEDGPGALSSTLVQFFLKDNLNNIPVSR